MNDFSYFKNWQKFATFPCFGNTKKPSTKNGYKDASIGNDVLVYVRAGFNVGLALEPSSLIAIDCDVDSEKGYNGIETLTSSIVELGPLPKTLTQSTPRGGRHYIFSSKGVINPIGKIGKDIDVKFNGYVMLAPSSINGKSYEIIDGIDENGNFCIAELPETWLNFLNKKNSSFKKNDVAFKRQMEHKSYKSDPAKIFQNCPFLNFCKENAEDLPEPMWHSMIVCLAQIDDSDDLIHELSEPYYGYDFNETQKKIDLARDFGHPQTCEYIAGNYPEICKECSNFIKVGGNYEK